MKKLTLILMAIIAMTMTAYGQWSLQTNPLGSGDEAQLGKIQFVSATEGWIAAGHSGKLLHTTDAGTTWNIVNPFPSDITGSMSDPGVNMSWPNATHGMVLKTYIAGTGDITNIANGAVLYSTTDGGNSWVKKDLPKSVPTITYNTSDLQGTWQIHEIAVKNPVSSKIYNGWMHGTLTLNAAGSGSQTNIVTANGSQLDVNGVSLQISSLGEITVSGSSDLHGFMNPDKNTIIITSNEQQGNGYALYVLQKKVSETSYSLADLQGDWQMHGLSAGNSTGAKAGWVHATLTGDAGGNFIGNFTSVGGSGGINTSISITQDGFIIGLNNIGSNVHGFMSADKKTFYITMTGNEGSDYNLITFQKQEAGTTYSLSDLQGFWQSHTLVSDNIYDSTPWASWSHSRSTINSKGDVNISNLVVNGQNRDDISTGISITSQGIITFDEVSNSHGFLSADKSFAIMTMPDEGSGGYTLGFLQKDLTVSGDIGLQAQFVNNNTGWMSLYNPVYETFNVYKTTDGGQTWNPSSITVGGLYYFVDANNGWMIGNSVSILGDGGLNNIYHTTNGGTSWVLQKSNIGDANALHFSDLLNGWVVGRNGLVLKTNDGGTTWTAITTTGQTSNSNSKAVFFTDANHGWIGSSNHDYSNNDDSPSTTVTDNSNSSNVNTDGVGTQFILATQDGGVTWETQDTPVTNSIFSISFWDANNGWFTSDYGQIAHYTYTPPKTVDITAGGLSSVLSTTEKNTFTDLKVTGTIDARDFKTMRDEMPMLANIDLSAATISAYTGSEGTYSTGAYSYPANTLSRNALYKKTTLKSIKLPADLTSIGRSALNSCTALTTITIPSSVVLIDSMAFRACTALKMINIPASVRTIGYAALSYSGLTNIVLPNGVTTIGDYAFNACTALKKINIPASVQTIGYAAFCYSDLTDIVLPNGVTTIGDYAFQNCASLSSVSIPSTVTHSGYCAFTFDNALQSINVSSMNPIYSSVDGVLYDKSQQRLLCFPGGKATDFIIPSTVSVIDTAAFEGINNIQSVKIPSSVTKLSVEAFYWCPNLKAIDIPASVTSIGSYAFYNCSGLTSLIVHSSIPVDLSASDSVFKYVNTNYCSLYVPSGSKSAYQAAYQWSDFTNITELGNSITYNVTVPFGTKCCYIAGEMNNWTQQPMTKVDDTHYTITLQNVNVNQQYKYCSGPGWDYVENDADGFDIINRSYSTNDVVVRWANVYNPPKVTASDYYLPLKIGNYTELHTIYTQVDGWSPRTTRYSINRTDMINGIPYYLEKGWEGNYSNCNSCIEGPFRYLWIRKDSFGNILLGAYADSDDNGNLTDDITKAYVLPQPVLWFPNTFLNVGGYTTFAIEDNVMQIDSVISINATAGIYNNCLQIRDIQRTKSGIVTFMEDSYYAYQIGLVMENRLVPLEDVHTNSITGYVADTTTVIRNIKGSGHSFGIYPNPASNGFYIHTGSTASSPVSIYDLNGRMMLTKQVSDKEFISISNFKKGIYIVKIQTESGSFATKLVKE